MASALQMQLDALHPAVPGLPDVSSLSAQALQQLLPDQVSPTAHVSVPRHQDVAIQLALQDGQRILVAPGHHLPDVEPRRQGCGGAGWNHCRVRMARQGCLMFGGHADWGQGYRQQGSADSQCDPRLQYSKR